ncbi:hypothetical protein [Solwaraspora sp. WMMA2065]|uniref:hypothetical protein n=1 Tax=Solwaraspora sp. WMMA2065 TaxID=3015166 RepID=UPI00259B41F6|nr:hypothetical protein [Solwaraspora sp. WMMA2065]WJK34318.1 hypothetical protein O7610_27545 [Solwaraspora sp. WMMA2065]
MYVRKRALAGTVAAAAVALTMLGASAAHAAPDGGKATTGSAVTRLDDRLAPDRTGRATVAASVAASAMLETIQRRIADYVATHGTKYTFGSYLDATTGKIVVDTDAPADLVAALIKPAGTSAAHLRAASELQVSRSTISDFWHRRDDIQPYWGGGGITQTAGAAWCSAGYAVRNGAGTRFSVTAGHCFANGINVLTESGANAYGVVSNRRLPTVSGHAQDMELVGGRSYSGRIFTGGVTSTSSAPVVAAGTAYVGFSDYCHSGRTTGEHCGHTATSITGQVCTSTGCKSPVIVFNGGTQPAGGDSGSPFYVKDTSGGAWIRGNVIAGNGVTSYAERYIDVAAAYGVSIVTG